MQSRKQQAVIRVSDLEHGEAILKEVAIGHPYVKYLFIPEILEQLVTEHSSTFQALEIVMSEQQKFTFATLYRYPWLFKSKYSNCGISEFSFEQILNIAKACLSNSYHAHKLEEILLYVPLFNLNQVKILVEATSEQTVLFLLGNKLYAADDDFLQYSFIDKKIQQRVKTFYCPEWMRVVPVISLKWVDANIDIMPDAFIALLAESKSQQNYVSNRFIERLITAQSPSRQQPCSTIYINLNIEQVKKYAYSLFLKYVLWGKLDAPFREDEQPPTSEKIVLTLMFGQGFVEGHLPVDVLERLLRANRPGQFISSPSLIYADRELLIDNAHMWRKFVNFSPEMEPVINLAIHERLVIETAQYAIWSLSKDIIKKILIVTPVELLSKTLQKAICTPLTNSDLNFHTPGAAAHVLRAYQKSFRNNEKVQFENLIRSILLDSELESAIRAGGGF